MIESETDRGTAAERVPDESRFLDAQLVEQPGEGVGGEGEVVALDRRLVRPAEARLVDHDRAEVLGEDRQVAAEVRQAGSAGAAAVQHDDDRSLPGLREVELHSMPSAGTSRPNSPRPNMDSARSGSLIACTRPACASRQNRWIGVPVFSARPPEFSKSRSMARIAWAVPYTWSRRTRSRSGIDGRSPARAATMSSVMSRSRASQVLSISAAASATRTWPYG